MKKATIKIKRKYFDTELQRLVFPKESLDVSLERAKIICDKGLGDVVEVNHIDEKNPLIGKDTSIIKPELPNLTFYNNGNGMRVKTNTLINPLNDFSKKELIKIAKEKGIKVTGLKKQELIDKLLECK